MAVDGNGEVSSCGRENIGIDLGFRDDVTGASVSISVSVSEEEVDIVSEGEDIMIGVSGADIFFDGIYGTEGQEEEEDVIVVRDDEDEFNEYEINIDETLEINDSGVYEVQETPAGDVKSSDEIVSRVRALVQSLPMPGQIRPDELKQSFNLPGQISPQESVPSFSLPGQISPQELVPVVKPQLLASDNSFEGSKYRGINQSYLVPKRKRDRIDVKVKPKECGTGGQRHADAIFNSSMASRFQEFEDFLNVAAKHPTSHDKNVSQLQMAAHAGEGGCNHNFEKQLGEETKIGLPRHSACDSSLVSPVKDIKDSYWTDMVIQTESTAELPPVSTVRGSKAYKSVSTRLSEDVPNKRLRMNTLNYNHAPVAATANKCSPAELILTFDDIQAIPSEFKLYNIFRRFGPLIKTETLIYYESCCARVVFKKSSDAEVAVSSAKAFNFMGPSVLKYELGYNPLSAASVMQVAESEAIIARDLEPEVMNAGEVEPEVMNARDIEPEVMNAGAVEPEVMNAPESEHQEIVVQQMQFEHSEETPAAGVTLESGDLEGLDDVDIME